MFVPGVLHEALFYAFHRSLFEDVEYRPAYDDARARLLEQEAVEAFRGLLPDCESGWNLQYGPKKARLELDGLILYDGKLILIEAKWKSPTLVARGGDVRAALADVNKAILDPLRQAKRARDYIHQDDAAEFLERTAGRRIVVNSADVQETFLVTLVGSGAWAHIAANLADLTPMGLFADGEYPWALSLNDLRLVAGCLELPSQLFDYLRRRYEMQRNPRFRLHDEWDFLGAYLAGALDVDDPRFAGMDAVALDNFDSEIQDYCFSLSNPLTPPVDRPRRKLPDNIWQLLVDAEGAAAREKTDAICAVLSWPDGGLLELSSKLHTP